MAGNTIVRIASMTKPIVAACAMTLVEDCTLRLDDPVDDLLPELADMTVLADPDGPLNETVPAARPITLRDLLTFTLGTGMVDAVPDRSRSPTRSTPSAGQIWTSGRAAWARCRWSTSRVSAGCTRPPPT